MSEQLTETERREASKPFLAALQKYAVPDATTLFSIDPHTLELMDFRQDCLERLATATDDEQRADIQLEIDSCDMELRKLCENDVAKVNNFCTVLKMLDALILHRKDERDRQARMAKRWEAIKAGMEQIAIDALQAAGTTRFDTPTNTLRIQRNPPHVEYTEPNLVPDRLRTVTLTIPADRYKQLREAQPELIQWVTEKGATFNTSEVAKILKKAAKEEAAARELMDGLDLQKTLKQIERVKGAELKSDIRLVVE